MLLAFLKINCSVSRNESPFKSLWRPLLPLLSLASCIPAINTKWASILQAQKGPAWGLQHPLQILTAISDLRSCWSHGNKVRGEIWKAAAHPSPRPRCPQQQWICTQMLQDSARKAQRMPRNSNFTAVLLNRDFTVHWQHSWKIFPWINKEGKPSLQSSP